MYMRAIPRPRAQQVLEHDVLQLLVAAKQTSNPLFLRMTIDELVAVAVHETVLPIAKHCCSLRSCLELCGMLLERYEEEFGRQLVQRTFGLIASSRYGIAEDELMQLLDVPLDEWSPFFLATRGALCSVDGKLNISNHVMSRGDQMIDDMAADKSGRTRHERGFCTHKGSNPLFTTYQMPIRKTPGKFLARRPTEIPVWIGLGRFDQQLKYFVDIKDDQQFTLQPVNTGRNLTELRIPIRRHGP